MGHRKDDGIMGHRTCDCIIGHRKDDGIMGHRKDDGIIGHRKDAICMLGILRQGHRRCSYYLILTASLRQKSYANAPQFCVARTLTALLTAVNVTVFSVMMSRSFGGI